MQRVRIWGLMLLCLLAFTIGAQGQSVLGAGRLDIGGGQSASFSLASTMGFPATGCICVSGTGGSFPGTFRANFWAGMWLYRLPDNPDDDAATPLCLLRTVQGVFCDLHGVSTLVTAQIELSEDGRGSMYIRVLNADYTHFATYGKILAETRDGAGNPLFAPVTSGKIQFNFWY